MKPIGYWLLRAKLAAISLLNPWRAVRDLRAENKRLCDAIADPFITGLHVGNGTFELGLQAPAAELMAGMFLGMFEKYPDAKNYIECTFSSKAGPVRVTVVRPNGRSPDDMRREAEAKLAECLKRHNVF